MPPKHVAPKLNASSFNCPRCGVLCQQTWYDIYKDDPKVKLVEINLGGIAGRKKSYNSFPIGESSFNSYKPVKSWDLQISVCKECGNYTIWHQEKIIFPHDISDIPEPSEDMPDDAKAVYEEARMVFQHSPRAAAALLRLSIEMVLKHILEASKDQLDDLIKEIVKGDIPEHIQQGLDSLRYYGNKGIHAGEINLNEERPIVIFLFNLANGIIVELITRKKEIDSFYKGLPEGFRKHIQKRDGVIDR